MSGRDTAVHEHMREQAHEHEFEAAHGLPEPLPAGEHILWQGAPDFIGMARRVFHVRAIGGYFAVILLLRGLFAGAQAGSALDGLLAATWLLPPVLIAMGMLYLMAFLSSRTAVYTITDRRVVMRIGIVLSLTFNLPFNRIRAADARLRAGRTGDIALTLDDAQTHIAYVHLWPHARPWRVARTQPMLRCLPDAERVAALLSQAWRDARANEAQRAMPLPVAQPVAAAFPMPTPVRQPVPRPVAGLAPHARLAG